VSGSKRYPMPDIPLERPCPTGHAGRTALGSAPGPMALDSSSFPEICIKPLIMKDSFRQFGGLPRIVHPFIKKFLTSLGLLGYFLLNKIHVLND
jgi:hypothetical protein